MNFNIFKAILRDFAQRQANTALCFGALWLLAPQLAIAQEVAGGCGPLRTTGAFGPYDYRPEKYIPDIYRSHEVLLKTVEEFHFTPEIESLRRGKLGGQPNGDIAYTLHAFPNHHRALIAMVKLGEKEKTPQPNGVPYPVECWFSRAIAFRPDDNIVRMIYANYLSKMKRESEAEQQLSIAARQAGDNAFTLHNIGIIYFDMKNYERALVYAHKAYELGLGWPTLREQLKSVGKWSEPAEAPPAEPAKDPQ
jgi:tetratricopeptide (TPR) repeat protein